MENNQFERDVHDRMQEFKIQPPDSVWQHIEQKIKKPASRRSGLLVVLLLLLLGTAAILFLPIRKQDMNHNAKYAAQQNTDRENTPQRGKVILPENKTDGAAQGKKSLSGQKNANGDASIQQDIATAQQDIFVAPPDNPTPPHNISNTRRDIIIPGKDNSLVTPGRAANSRQEHDFQEIPGPIQPPKTAPGAVAALPDIYLGAISPTLPSGDHPLSENLFLFIPKNKQHRGGVHINKQIAHTDKDISSKKPSWSFGLSFAPGIAHIRHGIFGLKSAQSSADYLNSPPYSSSPGVFLSEPELRQAFGLSAGFMAKRKMSKTSSILLGINYKYAALNLKVGERIGNISSAMNVRFDADNRQNNYKNQFHFIEVPVTYQLRLGAPLHIPLFLQAGVHGAVFIHSNALQIHQGQFQSNRAQLSGFQFGLDGALMAQLFSGKKIHIKAGPWIQYNLTQMDDENIFRNSYLNMLGLKTEIFFGK